MKNFYFLLFIIISILFLFKNFENESYYKVWKLTDSNCIFVDTNKNYIFDETIPIKIHDIFYINKDTDLNKFPLLAGLTEEEKVYLEYYASEFLNNTLKNKFVKIKNKKIYVDSKKLDDVLLSSNLFFNYDINTQKKLLDYIKSVNIDNFVIYNTKSRKYHRLGCIFGQKSKNYILITKDKMPVNSNPCGECFLNKYKMYKQSTVTKKDIKYRNYFLSDRINIYFLNLNQVLRPSSQCLTDACKRLKNEIDNANYSIDFAIYGIDNQPEIFNALVNAQKRGVKIRWVFDYDKKYYNYYSDTLKLKEIITANNSDKKYEDEYSSAIMHNKFFIFDNKKIWTGSANITGTDLTGFNANYSVLIDNPEIAEIYTNEFLQMYNGKFHRFKEKNTIKEVIVNDETSIKVLFSPQDDIMPGHIIPLILNAKKYVYIPVFFFTDKKLSKALQIAYNKGVDVKIITDATNASSRYTVHKELRKNGIKVKTENHAGKMHMKAIIIDDKISVLGSMNFTKSANYKNDENVLIINNSEIANYLKQTFLYLWSKIPDEYEYRDPKAESLESIGSCYDGIDNDFDEKIDKEDYGCQVNK